MTTLGDWVNATGILQAKYDRGTRELRGFLEAHVLEDSVIRIYEDNNTLKEFSLRCRIPGNDRDVRITRELQPLPRPSLTVCVDDDEDPIEFPCGSTILADEVTRWVSEKVGCRLI